MEPDDVEGEQLKLAVSLVKGSFESGMNYAILPNQSTTVRTVWLFFLHVGEDLC